MRVLEVIPISRGITSETLSYFTGSDISVGSIVKVPLRKRVIPALVISVKEVEESKSEIKNYPYQLKKIEKIKSFNLLKKEFVQTAQKIADYYAGGTGSVLSSIIPKFFIENTENLKIQNELEEEKNIIPEKFVIQANDEDRYTHYKSIIREEFAKGYSVFFCLPTIQDIKKSERYTSKRNRALYFYFTQWTFQKRKRKYY